MSNLIYVSFMPWLTLYQSVTLGKITFWNYSREAAERIDDLRTRERLEKHFNSYKNIDGSLNPITICSYEGKTFYDGLNEQEYNHLREAVTALVFASFAEKIEWRIQEEQSHCNPPSINAFDLMFRQLSFDSDYYSHLSLSIKSFQMKESRSVFQKPLGTREEADISTKWSKCLNSYLALKDSSKLKKRISRSLEFFRLAQAQDDLKDNSEVSAFLTRTVLMITAFESLFFPRWNETVSVNRKILEGDKKTEFFSNYIDERFKTDESRRSSRKFWNRKRTRISRTEQLSLIAWWAYDFYKLRNSIVHGNKVDIEKLRFKEGLSFSQMDVAVLVFADCLEEIILNKVMKSKERDKLMFYTFFTYCGYDNWKKHHKVLGWLKPSN